MRPGLGSKMDGRCLGVLLLHRVSKAWEVGNRKRGVCLVTGAPSSQSHVVELLDKHGSAPAGTSSLTPQAQFIGTCWS